MKTVLLVDDDPAFRARLVPALSARGLTVLEASTGGQATSMLETDAPDLIILDGLLPDVDCVAWVRELRTRGNAATLVYVGAFWKDLDAFKALGKELLVQLVVQKPVIPAAFALQVDRLLQAPQTVPPPPTAPSSGSEDLDAALAVLREQYGRALPGRLKEIGRQLDALAASPQDVTALEAVRMGAHKLRGTAGSFGFAPVGVAMAALEEGCLGLRGQDNPGSSSNVAPLRMNLDAARISLGSASQGAAAGPTVITPTRVLLVDDEPGSTALVLAASAGRAMELDACSTAEEALARLAMRRFDAAVVDLGNVGAALKLVRLMRTLPGAASLPVAFLVPAHDVQHNVAAVLAGASLVVARPLEPALLQATVQQLVGTGDVGRPRILLLDDDAVFGAQACAVLESHGMETLQLTSPDMLLGALESLQPDVLLLDVNMPDVSGHDICRMLRAKPQHLDLPILCVTTDAGVDSRIAAFTAGADDYLCKPIVPQELVARVKVRVERGRLVKERSETDGLTRLLNRTAFTRELRMRLGEAKRHGKQLTVALLDADKFKNINDTHGHLAGDRVLATVGQLLGSRFRAEDLRARWGGEELVLAFPDTPLPVAVGVAERLLAEIRSLEFKGDSGTQFTCTVSAGLASFPDDGETAEDLIRCADHRMYAAKRAGRDRVVSTDE